MFKQALRTLKTESQAISLAFDKISSKQTLSTQKSPIVILHGLFGNKMSNRSMANSLNSLFSNDRDIYLLDLRNHGSSPHATPHDYPSMSLDVANFLRAHQLEQPILVGHSMGAKVVMDMILQRQLNHQRQGKTRGADAASLSLPGVRMGVCIENAPVVTAPNGNFVRYIDALDSAMVHEPAITSRAKLVKYLSGRLPRESESLVQFLATQLQQTVRGGAFHSRLPLPVLRESIVRGAISAFPVAAEIAQTQTTTSARVSSSPSLCSSVPMLFIRGADSGYLCDEYIASIGAYFANFELKTISGGSHFVNSERPRECAELIYEFIDRRED